jgi:iron complex outermembrane recepter protein
MRAAFLFVLLSSLASMPTIWAQNTGSVRGKVTLASSGNGLHNAVVRLAPGGRSTETAEDGSYAFDNLPAGEYRVFASMRNLADETQTISVKPGETATADFALKVAVLRQQVTVTATGAEQTALESFESTASLESHELVNRAASTSLGEALENEPGIAKRSFGPGTSRPVVRGFDGDRVLILGDGIRTGTLSSQSGDHGEPVDVSNSERVEVVRGPATLLYGSGALGGVVNVLTPFNQLHEHPHEGLRGHLTGIGGTTNGLGGGSGSLQYGRGAWSLFGSGGGLRAGDYNTPIGKIPNSSNWMRHVNLGLGRFEGKLRFSGNYGYQEGEYGVPFAAEFHGHEEDHDHDAKTLRFARPFSARPFGEEDEHEEEENIRIGWRRHNIRFNVAAVELGGFAESFTNHFNYSDWNHNELEGAEVGTRFFNKQFNWQGIVQQRRAGLLTGSFGGWYQFRDFEAQGEEALAPPTTQNSFALFAVEQLNFERLRFQFGGRFERNSFDAEGLRKRSFNGLSASAGVNFRLSTNTVAVANYTHSYRAPALEELYNNGPHIGNLTYEIGNPNLTREQGNGVEVSLRHVTNRIRAELNTYYYDFNNFVFLAFQNEFDEGLPVAAYEQADSRYMGAEARFDAQLNQRFWLNLGFDAVDAQLKSRVPLPRIPPVRGRVGLDYRQGGFSVRPELVLSNRQWQVYPTETPTAGFAVLNLHSSYTIARQHAIHTFGAMLFNATDRVYRNHLSFIKDLAPEMGVGVRFTYTLNFF